MAICFLQPNARYRARNGAVVEVLSRVTSEFLGAYFRARFTDTNEIVFYRGDGNIVSDRPGADDSRYVLGARL